MHEDLRKGGHAGLRGACSPLASLVVLRAICGAASCRARASRAFGTEPEKEEAEGAAGTHPLLFADIELAEPGHGILHGVVPGLVGLGRTPPHLEGVATVEIAQSAHGRATAAASAARLELDQHSS